MPLQRANGALQLAPIGGVGKDLPRPEDALAQCKPSLPELPLGGQPVGVRGEVTLEVCPAQLAAVKRQVGIRGRFTTE